MAGFKLIDKNRVPARDRMGTDPIPELLFRMAGPSIIAMLMQALYNTVDSMFVARISDGSLAAVTLAFPVQMIIGAMSTGIGVGINSSISRKLGAKEIRGAGQATANGLMIGIVTVLLSSKIGLYGIWIGIFLADLINLAFVILMNVRLRHTVLSRWELEKGETNGI